MRILARFASATGAEIDEAIRSTLGEIAQLVGADYVYVIQATPGLTDWSVTHDWCSRGFPASWRVAGRSREGRSAGLKSYCWQGRS